MVLSHQEHSPHQTTTKPQAPEHVACSSPAPPIIFWPKHFFVLSCGFENKSFGKVLGISWKWYFREDKNFPQLFLFQVSNRERSKQTPEVFRGQSYSEQYRKPQEVNRRRAKPAKKNTKTKNIQSKTPKSHHRPLQRFPLLPLPSILKMTSRSQFNASPVFERKHPGRAATCAAKRAASRLFRAKR